MAQLIFVTHPEVRIDPRVDVRQWSLSPAGVERMRLFAAGDVVRNVGAIWSSTETKAREAAEILAHALSLEVRADRDLGENDRTATGFLPPIEFEKVADQFFANPEESVRGWERAVDAQRRIRCTVDRIIRGHRGGDLAIASHGAVGTLLKCSYKEIAITRAEDQAFQGHYWTADFERLSVVTPWAALAPRI
ncbi:histidine phosphatase family protein [Mesorhizobium sp. LHD-90]|uniref:histidine phosphatase family protein n=1 Tax=Mesorhizobium sp. LHD-90 TaxID=3071414 RepID=UPI0027DF967E|nr:histidine phosphatase family protein [Mesorhizobium sp. LHD-90]MDQ6438105.1 histidine phosphatase family protein [Mesorhizobium sp. LHD-90]